VLDLVYLGCVLALFNEIHLLIQYIYSVSINGCRTKLDLIVTTIEAAIVK